MGRAIVTYADYNGEKSVAQFDTLTPVQASYDADVASIQGIFTGIDLITLGLNVKERIEVVNTGVGSGQASSANAQRELKWLVRFQDDSTSEVFTREIPTPDLSLLDPNNRGYMNIASGNGATFVANLEAAGRTPNGNTLTVLDVKLVGRNL